MSQVRGRSPEDVCPGSAFGSGLQTLGTVNLMCIV